MKILIVQLARLGDILLTWPTVRALRRKNPRAEIHVLTRPRFAAAWEGCDPNLRVRCFETRNILAPLISESPNIQESFSAVSEFIEQLRADEFDRIINLTFSPLSSYLVDQVSHSFTKITGYTRTADGYLAIPDDMSAYFFAQVGADRANRFHLAEVFATLADCDLALRDWLPLDESEADQPRSGIVVHIGASERHKSLTDIKWSSICRELLRTTSRAVTIIGSSAESIVGEVITNSIYSSQFFNMVGKTSIPDVFKLISKSELLIGCDSMAIHVASLTQTPTLNLSVGNVNFWETGPRAKQSYVARAESEVHLASDDVAQAASCVIRGGGSSPIKLIPTCQGTPSFVCEENFSKTFQWRLILAIYQGHEFPQNHATEFQLALEKLREVNSIIQTQLQYLKLGGQIAKSSPIIETSDEIISAIENICPETGPLIRWYKTEKTRIAPGSRAEVLDRTSQIHSLFNDAINELSIQSSHQSVTG